MCKKRGIEQSLRGVSIEDANAGRLIAVLEKDDEDLTDE